MKYTLIKLGGSVITDKSKAFTARDGVIERLVEELRGYDGRMVLGNGAGSFGHNLAKEYLEDLRDVHNKKGLEGYKSISVAVRVLNGMICDALGVGGFESVGMHWEGFDEDVLKKVLSEGRLPVFHGDIVKGKKEFEIWSTEDIFDCLVDVLPVERVIMVSDVDGVFDGNGDLMRVVTDESVMGEVEMKGDDVTGGMLGKVEKSLRWAQKGIDTVIVNGMVEGRLKRLLLGEEVVCSVVSKG